MPLTIYPQYPADIYPLPDYGSYSGIVDQGLTRTSAPAAAPNQEVGFNSPRNEIVLTFSMTNTVFESWMDWVEQFGWSWFEMSLVTSFEPVLITSTHRFRMTSQVTRVKRGDNWVSASVSVEMVIGDYEDPAAVGTREYDFIIAGTPASPSVDEIIAGDPLNSVLLPKIAANLYYYTKG